MGEIDFIFNKYGKEELSNIRIVSIGKEELRFLYLDGEKQSKEVLLKAGYEYISKTFYKHDIPTEAEVEYAINFIEDELMSEKSLLNNNERFLCLDQAVLEILQKNNESKELYSSRDIENIFSGYARLSMGEPISRSGLQTTREDFAIILILREIMHHLKFKEIHIMQ
jgi:hypothetical protein